MITVCLANVAVGTSPEQFRCLDGDVLLGGALVWRALLWLFSGPVSPDPWVKRSKPCWTAPRWAPSPPLFHAVGPTDWFVRDAGGRWEIYNNWNPYLYIFSLAKACVKERLAA